MIIDAILISAFQLILTYVIVRLSHRYNLLDFPTHRKLHTSPTPYTGGIIITSSFLFLVFITDYNVDFINLTLSFSLLICLAGFLDDLYKFKPGTKIILQILPIFFLVEQGLFLTDIVEFNSLGTFKLGSFSKMFTILACLFLINAFNYNDGIDGLTVLLSILILLFFALCLKLFTDNLEEFYFLITKIIPLFIFFIFNFNFFKNYKIFLGDSGSNTLGFIFSFFAIGLYKFSNLDSTIIIWGFSYLVYEFLTVTIIRLKKNKKVFDPGLDHFHYQLKLIHKFTNLKINFTILLLNCFFMSFGLLSYLYLSKEICFLLYIIMFILYLIFRAYVFKNDK